MATFLMTLSLLLALAGAVVLVLNNEWALYAWLGLSWVWGKVVAPAMALLADVYVTGISAKRLMVGSFGGNAVSWFSTAQAVWAGYAGAGERGRRPRRFGAARFDLYTNRDGRNSENATAVMDRESPIAHAPTGGGQQSPAAQLELKGELARCGIEVPGYLRMKCFGASP